MSKKSLSKFQGLLMICAVPVTVWFVIFQWDWVRYPCDLQTSPTCSNPVEYATSPNGEYYIVRLQTPFEAAFEEPLYAVGTAKLYNKHGKLLYSGKAHLGEDYGPNWCAACSPPGAQVVCNEERSCEIVPRNKVPTVYFDQSDWDFALPSSPE
jgi:hypothetical protein